MSDVIGRSVRRSDGAAKVTGAATYCLDRELPRMLHAKLLRSPVAAGRIVRLDSARARALPGVRAVVTAADAPARSGMFVKDQPLLADGSVRYIGEPVAAVAADTAAAASAALAAIELEIEAAPAVHRLSAVTPGEVVLRNGAAGAYAGAVHIAAAPVERVVDTTAAGDSFAGGYLAARLAGDTPERAAARANALAAYVIQHRGAIAPNPATSQGASR